MVTRKLEAGYCPALPAGLLFASSASPAGRLAFSIRIPLCGRRARAIIGMVTLPIGWALVSQF